MLKKPFRIFNDGWGLVIIRGYSVRPRKGPEVEVPNHPARITFSFEFEENSSEIDSFEVTKVEGSSWEFQ
jgi:hypothetical protein